jgi:hypothetical protein
MYDLVEAMNSAVAYMQQAEDLQQGCRHQIAELIASHIIECGHFISKYASTECFCKSI